MAGVTKKSFDSPDETRTPDKTEVRVVDLGGLKAARITFQPGWNWSDCIKPVVQTESCQLHHEGTLVQGRMHVVHDGPREAPPARREPAVRARDTRSRGRCA